MSVARQVAALLLEAHATGRQVAPFAVPALESLDDVYAAQDLVIRELGTGRRVQAWKVIPPQGGADPRAAPVFPGRILDSPATLSASELHMLGVEAENLQEVASAAVGQGALPMFKDLGPGERWLCAAPAAQAPAGRISGTRRGRAGRGTFLPATPLRRATA